MLRLCCLIFFACAFLASQAHAGAFDGKEDIVNGVIGVYNGTAATIKGWMGGAKDQSSPPRVASATGSVRQEPGLVRLTMPQYICKRFMCPAENALKRKTGMDIEWVDEFVGKTEFPYGLNNKRERTRAFDDVALRYGDMEALENSSDQPSTRWKGQNFTATVLAANPLILVASGNFPLNSLSSKELREILLGENVVIKPSSKAKTSWEIVPIIRKDQRLAYTLRRDLLNDRPFADNVVRFDNLTDLPFLLTSFYLPPDKKTGVGRASVAVIGTWDAVEGRSSLDGGKLIPSDLKIEVPYILIVSGRPTPAAQKLIDFFQGEGAMFVTPELPRGLKQN